MNELCCYVDMLEARSESRLEVTFQSISMPMILRLRHLRTLNSQPQILNNEMSFCQTSYKSKQAYITLDNVLTLQHINETDLLIKYKNNTQ